jgi:glycogen(starch) synthase
VTSNRPRVVLAGFYPPPFGGESVHVFKLASLLRAEGMLEAIVNVRRGAPASVDYVRGAGPARLAAALLRTLNARTLLHLHTNGHSWKSWAMIGGAALVLASRRVPGVLTLHSGMGPAFVRRVGPGGRGAIRLALRGFAHIVCVNEEIARGLNDLGVPRDRLSVIPAFLGAVSGSLPEDDERALQRFRPLLSVIAGSGSEYGLTTLLEALDVLTRKHPTLGCVILGTDAREVAGRAPADRSPVTYFGPVTHDRCLAVVARSDVFVRPSLADGDAVSVREAVALGVRVVASDVVPRPGEVTLFRTGDSGDLAARLDAVLDARNTRPASADAPEFGAPILSVYERVTAPTTGTTRLALVESTRRGARSLARELVQFRVEYPIEIVTDAARPDALRYHVYHESLFLDDQILDAGGVPQKVYRLLGAQYNPLFVAWWGLHHLERAARQPDGGHLDVFLTQLAWLKANAVVRGDGAIVWPCYFDWQEGRARLRAPWISAMYQGVVISALVRGYRVTGDVKLLDLALGGTRVFELDVDGGGVRSRADGRTLYEEYPAFPLPRVLDGFLFSLLGLYDLSVQTNDPGVRRLFDEGLEGLVAHLSWWDYRGKWSWYGSHRYLCPPHYHALNRTLLSILHRVTGGRALGEAAQRWAPENLSRRDRVEVFLAFAATKNWARVRLPNQRGG